MESVTELIKCSICLDTFDSSNHQPRCFPCGHSFGLSCIQLLRKAATNRCPTCKTEVNLSIDHPINFQLIGILDALKASSSQNSSPLPLKSSPSLCSNCNRAHPSLRTCIKCDTHPILCPHCARINHNGHSFLSFDPAHEKKEAVRSLKKLGEALSELNSNTNELFTQCIDSLKKLQKECQSQSILRNLETLAERNPDEAVKRADEASALIGETKINIVQVLSPFVPILESISFDLVGAKQDKEEKDREDADYMLALSLSVIE
uniref:Zinc finger protein n=1 Tax=Pristionchus pacificus TaxID=54126 RepID=A0A8R1UPK0_PRIPA